MTEQIASESIYRVIIRTTDSLQPERSWTAWHREVAYCGPSLRDARVAFLREQAKDYGGSYGNRSRDTLIERFDAEPDDIDSTDAEPVDVE